MRHLFVLVLTVIAATAMAMSIRRYVHLLTWSPDGLSAFLNFSEDGPEGGGSNGYGVVTCGGILARVTVGSDFSPGGGSTPQTVSPQACRDALGALDKALNANGFKDVKLDPEGCGRADRNSMVDLEPFGTDPKSFSVAKKGEGLVLTEGTREVLEVPKASSLSVSPTGRAVLVFSGDRVKGLWTRKPGGPFVRCKPVGD